MKEYLGDGVYISDELNPGHLSLTTGSHRPEEADNIIHLEPDVIRAFNKFVYHQHEAMIQLKIEELLSELPTSIRTKIASYKEGIDIDNLEHDEVLIVMRVLAIGRWERKESGVEGKLDYVGTKDGIRIRLYAAGPPDSCRVVEEEYDIPASKGVRRRVICRETVAPEEL